MIDDNRPLSGLVAQGWEVIGFAASLAHRSGGGLADTILLRRQKSHKILKIQKKLFRGGYVVTEHDI